MNTMQPALSIVIPVYNEEPGLRQLHERLVAVLSGLNRTYEIIFVDDGSRDGTVDVLRNMVRDDGRVKVVCLRRNFRQTAALAAGFDEAQGSVVVAMDGDLQHAPEDIPALLSKLDEGYDIASGWREKRRDNAFTRRFPSLVANWLMAQASGVKLRDFGATFKAYRVEVLRDVRLYGELHRFIPALASFYGARVAEVPIQNPPRIAGASHYGLGRIFPVLFDILTIRFLLKYFTRPMHFFGSIGLAGTVAGSLVLGFCLFEKVGRGVRIFSEHGPLLIAGSLFLLAGLMMFSTGLIGELLIRTYFESQGRRIYAVREVIQRGPD